MESTDTKTSGTSWGADIGAGVVVCLVALPLCLGIALASGAPLAAGLITGIIGGLVVSWLGGTSLLVSGPAAGLAAIVIAAITELGSFEAFLAATVVAGVLQAVSGLARAGGLAALVPSSVVTGMLAAIGVLLILQQFPYAVGAVPAGGHGFELLLMPFRALPEAVVGPTVIGVISLAILIAWEYPVFAKVRKLVPGALVAVVVGTVLATLLPTIAPGMVLGAEHRVDLPDTEAGLMSWFAFPDWSALASPTTWRVAITLAVVASLETLLSMEATDRMDPLKRRSDGNRELFGQGVGNTIAGFVGGLPMTGVIVRSTANIAAGGRTWRAGFVHGVLLLASVASIPWLLENIPLATLAAVLLHTGWKLAHPRRFRDAARVGWAFAVPLYGTVIAVVATDLLIGVGVGLVLSGICTLAVNARHGVEVREVAQGNVRLELADAVSFVHKPRIRNVLDAAPEGAEIVVDASRTRVFDHDVVELLHGFADTAKDRRIRYQLIGVPDPHTAAG